MKLFLLIVLLITGETSAIVVDEHHCIAVPLAIEHGLQVPVTLASGRVEIAIDAVCLSGGQES